VSASSGGDINIDRPENLVHVVERLQQEMRELREQIETLENAACGILTQNALPAQWQSRMQ
jgi:cell division protein ZapA (FtsZ GTPase activity inhibitor)